MRLAQQARAQLETVAVAPKGRALHWIPSKRITAHAKRVVRKIGSRLIIVSLIPVKARKFCHGSWASASNYQRPTVREANALNPACPKSQGARANKLVELRSSGCS